MLPNDGILFILSSFPLFSTFSYVHQTILLIYLVFLCFQPECSVLLDSLELFACNPEVATGLAKCLLHVLQLAPEKTFVSFKTLDAIPRVLKVACIQAQDSRRPVTNSSEMIASQSLKKSIFPENLQRWRDCMEVCMQLFAEYFSVTEEAKCLVLNSSTCIDCLFDLFWEEYMRSSMLSYIFALMKVITLFIF